MTSTLRLVVSGAATCLFAAPIAAETSPPTPPRGPLTELACPQQTPILVLLQSARAPVTVTVDAVPDAGNATAQRLDAKTVTPQEMPATLELSPVVGERSVFVFVRDATRGGDDPKAVPDALDGYIGCGAWQAHLTVGEPNAFLLKRTALHAPQVANAPATSAPPAAAAPAPGQVPPPAPPGQVATQPPAEKAPPAETPSPPRKAIGVQIQNISDEVRSKDGIPRGVNGVIVRQVVSKSPAEAAKIEVGEIITTVDEHAVTDVTQLTGEIVRAGNAGNAWVTLRVVNTRGQTRTVRVGFWFVTN